MDCIDTSLNDDDDNTKGGKGDFLWNFFERNGFTEN